MTPSVYVLHTGDADDDATGAPASSGTPGTRGPLSSPGEPVTITVTGELDGTNAAGFADDIGAAAAGRPTVLDISALRFIDSAGFAELHRLQARHPVAVVVGPHSHLRRSAVLMGLPFHDDLTAARAGLGTKPVRD